jgi:hypothetical protein
MSKVIQKIKNEHVRRIGHGEGRDLNLAVVKLTTIQVAKLPL